MTEKFYFSSASQQCFKGRNWDSKGGKYNNETGAISQIKGTEI